MISKGMIRLVVCAAVRNVHTQVVVCGARHGDCLNAAVRYGLYPNPVSGDPDWEMGFVDQDNKFMNRQEAWLVADAAGQIRRPKGYERHYKDHRPPGIGDQRLLFSENLY